MHRWIDLDGVANMRDLGGLPTRDGRVIAPRRLIRSEHLQDLSPADVTRVVRELNVRDVVDLRTHTEVDAARPGPLAAAGVRHHHHSFLPEARPGLPPVDFLSENPDRVRPLKDTDYWTQHYRGYLTQRPDSVTAALAVIATSPGAVIVHCAAGKDRTGTVIALALAVAGVPHEAIIEDYLLTDERLDRVLDRLLEHEPYRTALRHLPGRGGGRSKTFEGARHERRSRWITPEMSSGSADTTRVMTPVRGCGKWISLAWRQCRASPWATSAGSAGPR